MLDTLDLLWTSLRRTFGMITDPRVLRLMVLCMIITCGVCALLGAYVYWTFSQVPLGTGAIDVALRLFGRIVGIYLLFGQLFPMVMSLSFFGTFDGVSEATERRYYPKAIGTRESSVGEMMHIGFAFGGMSIVVGLVSLALAHSLPGPHHVFLHLFFQGMVIGRMHWDWVAYRHMDPKAPETDPHSMKALRAATRMEITLAGACISLLYLLPFLNLFSPILGHVFMTHVFHNTGFKTAPLGRNGALGGGFGGGRRPPGGPRGNGGPSGSPNDGFDGPILDLIPYDPLQDDETPDTGGRREPRLFGPPKGPLDR